MPIPGPATKLDAGKHSALHNFHIDIRMTEAQGGGADDTAAIQAAIDAAPADGGEVFIPKGTWEAGTLNLRDYVRLVGEGWGSILKLRGATNAPLLQLADANVEGVQIESLWLDGNKANQTIAAPLVNLTNTAGVFNRFVDPYHSMRDVVIYQSKGSGLFTSSGTQECRLTNVRVHSCDEHGFDINGADSFLLDCLAANNGDGGFHGFRTTNQAFGVFFVNCKAFFNGSQLSGGSGFSIGHTAYLTNCAADDNGGDGFRIEGAAHGTQLAVCGARNNFNRGFLITRNDVMNIAFRADGTAGGRYGGQQRGLEAVGAARGVFIGDAKNNTVFDYGGGALPNNFHLITTAADTILRTPGALGVGNSALASALGSVQRKIEVFGPDGTSLGFVPVYDAIT